MEFTKKCMEALLTDYTQFLYHNGYTDDDVFWEEPKAVDRYMEHFEKYGKRVIMKHLDNSNK